ncbi:NrdA Ribonucleotide reductase, alpha subunit [uncultured Caudovirales phage]|uniref:ribonucleoside-diphosphate reductase n=1 Tax=uncultured Caudovirales phage TaxID=2100421 RepID=A0A6J5KZ29_9CAUD|nr:NrdA Ribonucleotide reductase, alpha subunit [uncultured Caudovirales phage]
MSLETTKKFCDEIFNLKYGFGQSREEVFMRTAKHLAQSDAERVEFYDAMFAGCIPGGRILANSGTSKKNTSLINCTVSGNIDDSIDGIMDKAREAALTLHTGAGIGYCFSTIRPRGAEVSGVGAHTSGAVSFMKIFDSMCSTISSAGGRRGAQMGTMHVWHPDIEEFISVKRGGVLTQFNLSVLVTDNFMDAVKSDSEWDLVFPIYEHHTRPPEEKIVILSGDSLFTHVKEWKIYKTVRARDLWEKIMRSNYDYAEPGVLFIDKINQGNPLNFFEKILATNPCGEQPLPPYGACLLGAINLTKFIDLEGKCFNYDDLAKNTKTFLRMLDRVVDKANLPLKQQKESIESTRRIGIGIMGLGSALNLLGIRYGNDKACALTSRVMETISKAAFAESVSLGVAPILQAVEDQDLYLNHSYVKRLNLPGIPRNTHRTTIAPTGTTAIAFGENCSGGIEPTFAHSYVRNVIVPGRKIKQACKIESYESLRNAPLLISTADVTPEEHIQMQAAAQYWVDSSISKTINVPADYPYENFKKIYIMAYDNGLKGCTTFRPQSNLGGVLRTDFDEIDFHIDGKSVVVRGDTMVKYEDETCTAQNLHDYLKVQQ